MSTMLVTGFLLRRNLSFFLLREGEKVTKIYKSSTKNLLITKNKIELFTNRFFNVNRERK